MESIFPNSFSPFTMDFFSLLANTFSNEQSFALINELVELKKREIEAIVCQQKLSILQIQLNKRVLEKEIVFATYDVLYMR